MSFHISGDIGPVSVWTDSQKIPQPNVLNPQGLTMHGWINSWILKYKSHCAAAEGIDYAREPSEEETKVDEKVWKR